MEKIANEFWKQHRGQGRVISVNDYSFVWETLPDKNDNTKQVTYMLSYFVEFQEEIMAHIYHVSEWQSPTGRWHCNDVEDLGNGSGYWWIPCRILGMAPTDFILMLKETFNASDFSYSVESNVLLYSWEKQSDMRRYKNWINEMARKANAVI